LRGGLDGASLGSAREERERRQDEKRLEPASHSLDDNLTRMMRTTLVAAAIALAPLAFVAGDARACTIVLPHLVLPALVPAPINAHIWVENAFDDESFVVRPAVPRGTQDAAVATDARLWNGWAKMIELVPRAQLDPSRRYEVWSRGSRWEGNGKAPYLVGTFVTSDAVDSTPPARPVVAPTARATVKWSSECGVGEVKAPIATPADQGSGELLYAIWHSDADGHIHYDRAPDRVVTAGPTGKPAFAYTQGSAFQNVKKLGLRAMDLAGNLSEPVEIAL